MSHFQVVVILVGTNNANNAEEVAEGILEIVRVVRDKQPEAYIVLLVTYHLYYCILNTGVIPPLLLRYFILFFN